MPQQTSFGRPFESFDKVWVIAPSDFSSLNPTDAQQSGGVRKLIEEHRVAIERELGCAFEFTENRDVKGAKWLIGPYRCNPAIAAVGQSAAAGPEIFLDRDKGLLVTDGTSPDEVTETYSYLRSLHRFEGGVWKIQDCASTDLAIDRIFQEVRTSFPAFQLRKLNWDAISERHIPLVRESGDPIPAMQRWLAELHDAHTWVRPFPPQGTFPYDLCADGNVLKLYRVPETSKAWQSGVRPGYELLGENLEDWQGRVGASPYSRPFVVGARVLTTPIGQTRKFSAKSQAGDLIRWEEESVQDRWSPVATWKRLPSGNGYLRIQAWLLGKNLEEQLDEAFVELKTCSLLIVDLRSNPGGNLLMAHRFRNRFLRNDGVVGWIQNTLPDGQLSGREPIRGELASKERRWEKRVIFLTDPLTYSASEDALLGLQGQEHVRVVGQRSGGGSGRMRLIRLLPGWRLTVSTALTYDLLGNCIEGNGIPVDIEFPLSFNSASLIEAAEKLRW